MYMRSKIDLKVKDFRNESQDIQSPNKSDSSISESDSNEKVSDSESPVKEPKKSNSFPEKSIQTLQKEEIGSQIAESQHQIDKEKIYLVQSPENQSVMVKTLNREKIDETTSISESCNMNPPNDIQDVSINTKFHSVELTNLIVNSYCFKDETEEENRSVNNKTQIQSRKELTIDTKGNNEHTKSNKRKNFLSYMEVSSRNNRKELENEINVEDSNAQNLLIEITPDYGNETELSLTQKEFPKNVEKMDLHRFRKKRRFEMIKNSEKKSQKREFSGSENCESSKHSCGSLYQSLGSQGESFSFNKSKVTPSKCNHASNDVSRMNSQSTLNNFSSNKLKFFDFKINSRDYTQQDKGEFPLACQNSSELSQARYFSGLKYAKNSMNQKMSIDSNINEKTYNKKHQMQISQQRPKIDDFEANQEHEKYSMQKNECNKNLNDSDALSNFFSNDDVFRRKDGQKTGHKPQKEHIYWVIDEKGPQNPVTTIDGWNLTGSKEIHSKNNLTEYICQKSKNEFQIHYDDSDNVEERTVHDPFSPFNVKSKNEVGNKLAKTHTKFFYNGFSNDENFARILPFREKITSYTSDFTDVRDVNTEGKISRGKESDQLESFLSVLSHSSSNNEDNIISNGIKNSIRDEKYSWDETDKDPEVISSHEFREASNQMQTKFKERNSNDKNAFRTSDISHKLPEKSISEIYKLISKNRDFEEKGPLKTIKKIGSNQSNVKEKDMLVKYSNIREKILYNYEDCLSEHGSTEIESFNSVSDIQNSNSDVTGSSKVCRYDNNTFHPDKVDKKSRTYARNINFSGAEDISQMFFDETSGSRNRDNNSEPNQNLNKNERLNSKTQRFEEFKDGSFHKELLVLSQKAKNPHAAKIPHINDPRTSDMKQTNPNCAKEFDTSTRVGFHVVPSSLRNSCQNSKDSLKADQDFDSQNLKIYKSDLQSHKKFNEFGSKSHSYDLDSTSPFDETFVQEVSCTKIENTSDVVKDHPQALRNSMKDLGIVGKQKTSPKIHAQVQKTGEKDAGARNSKESVQIAKVQSDQQIPFLSEILKSHQEKPCKKQPQKNSYITFIRKKKESEALQTDRKWTQQNESKLTDCFEQREMGFGFKEKNSKNVYEDLSESKNHGSSCEDPNHSINSESRSVKLRSQIDRNFSNQSLPKSCKITHKSNEANVTEKLDIKSSYSSVHEEFCRIWSSEPKVNNQESTSLPEFSGCPKNDTYNRNAISSIKIETTNHPNQDKEEILRKELPSTQNHCELKHHDSKHPKFLNIKKKMNSSDHTEDYIHVGPSRFFLDPTRTTRYTPGITDYDEKTYLNDNIQHEGNENQTLSNYQYVHEGLSISEKDKIGIESKHIGFTKGFETQSNAPNIIVSKNNLENTSEKDSNFPYYDREIDHSLFVDHHQCAMKDKERNSTQNLCSPNKSVIFSTGEKKSTPKTQGLKENVMPAISTYAEEHEKNLTQHCPQNCDFFNFNSETKPDVATECFRNKNEVSLTYKDSLEHVNKNFRKFENRYNNGAQKYFYSNDSITHSNEENNSDTSVNKVTILSKARLSPNHKGFFDEHNDVVNPEKSSKLYLERKCSKSEDQIPETIKIYAAQIIRKDTTTKQLLKDDHLDSDVCKSSILQIKSFKSQDEDVISVDQRNDNLKTSQVTRFGKAHTTPLQDPETLPIVHDGLFDVKIEEDADPLRKKNFCLSKQPKYDTNSVLKSKKLLKGKLKGINMEAYLDFNGFLNSISIAHEKFNENGQKYDQDSCKMKLGKRNSALKNRDLTESELMSKALPRNDDLNNIEFHSLHVKVDKNLCADKAQVLSQKLQKEDRISWNRPQKENSLPFFSANNLKKENQLASQRILLPKICKSDKKAEKSLNNEDLQASEDLESPPSPDSLTIEDEVYSESLNVPACAQNRPFSPQKVPKKRARTVIVGRKLEALKKLYKKNPFPNTLLREEIAYSLGIKPRTVQIWFQNQRQKAKTTLKDEGRFYGQLSMYRQSKNSNFALLDLLADAADIVFQETKAAERLQSRNLNQQK